MRNAEMERRLERAWEFVHRHGSGMMQGLAAAAAGKRKSGDILEYLVKFQNPDGGWRGIDSDVKAPFSTISSTLNALHWLLMIDVKDVPPLDETVQFLKTAQKSDGCWDESEEILKHSPKSWMLPGQRANQLWFTAAIGRCLDELGRTSDVDFDAAISFLRSGWDGRQYPQYPHTHWMALPLFSRLQSPSDGDRRIVEGCRQMLAGIVSQNRGWEGPGEYAEIACAALRSQPPAQDLFEMALQKILASQADDGGLAIVRGDIGDRVLATTKAMFLFRDCCRGCQNLNRF